MKINELFDTEFKMHKWDASPDGQAVYSYASDKQGRIIDINFIPVDTNEVSAVIIEFSRSGEYGLTGGGEAPAVFGTVIKAIERYLAGHQPDFFLFSAKEESRSSLYKSLIKRYANRFGYQIIPQHALPDSVQDNLAIGDEELLALKKISSN